MAEWEDEPRDLAALTVCLVGSVVDTGDPWEPWRLLDPAGVPVEPVSVFLRDLLAVGRPATTQRSYALALLRWFRFLWAVEIGWDRATRAEARDFCCWMLVAGKPGPGRSYASRTRVHSETVLRGFYDFHQDAASGPMVNPFPLVRGRRHGRAHAHHNPIEPYRDERGGLYRPAVAARLPRRIPDGRFND